MPPFEQAVHISKNRPDLTGLHMNPDEVKEQVRYKANLPSVWVRGFDGPIKDQSVVGTIAKKKERVGNRENRNQDNLILDPKTGLFGVTDGLGEKQGATAGAEASAVLADDFPLAYEQALDDAVSLTGEQLVERMVHLQKKKYGMDFPGLEEVLEERVWKIIEVDPVMAEKALGLLEATLKVNAAVRETGGKATLCTGLIHTAPDDSTWHVSINVGDSLAFKYKKETRQMIQVTVEDSLMNLLLQKNLIRPEDIEHLRQNPQAKFRLGNKELTYADMKHAMGACLGADDDLAIPSLTIRRVKSGDRILLATDGLEKKFRQGNGEEIDLKKLQGVAFPESRTVKVDYSLAESLDLLRQYEEPGTESDDIALVGANIE